MANKMLMKLNRFLFFQQPPPSPPPSWWSSSPSPTPSLPPNQEIIAVVLNSILERLKNHVVTDMFLSLFKTQSLVVGSTEGIISTAVILFGGLSILVVWMVFVPNPTLSLLRYIALACIYPCLGILSLVCLTCYYLIKGLCFTCRCIYDKLLSPVLSLARRWLLSALGAADSLFLQGMSWWLSHVRWITPSWVSAGWLVTCRWASTVQLVTLQWLLSSCYWDRVDSEDRGEEPSSENPAPENGHGSVGDGGDRNEGGAHTVVIDREKMKESEELRLAMLEEWIARPRKLERQAEKARTSKKVETKRKKVNDHQTRLKPSTNQQTPSRTKSYVPPHKRMLGNRAANQEGESSNSKLVFCVICMEYKANPQIFQGLSKCNHLFCIDCMVQYIASKINDKIVPVECPDPNCHRAIEPKDCGPVLPEELFGRWEMALLEASITGFQKFYCPFKDCSALMVADVKEEVTQSECPHCRRMFCAKCHVGWHAGVTCREFQRLGKDERTWEDLMLNKLAKDNQWKRCSKCRYYVEKNDGCIHMTCRCGYEFCYRCGAQWSNTHTC